MEIVFSERHRQGQVDLEATEGFIRSGVHRCRGLNNAGKVVVLGDGAA